MSIMLKRVYEKPSVEDGERILVERLWPRGLKKEDAKVDKWLESRKDIVENLAREAKAKKVTFVFGSKEEKLNNAAALKEYIETKLK